MKKFLAAVSLVALSASAIADGGRHNHNQHHGGNANAWIAPLVIGGIIGYSMTPRQEQAPIVQYGGYPQVYVPVQPQLTQPRVYNLGYPPPFPGARPFYQEIWQFEPTCQCQVKVYNQIGWQ